MATTSDHIATVLIGPACPACEPDDLRWGAPPRALQHGQCRECGTDYRSYRLPGSCELDVADAPPDPTCPSCGLPHDKGETGVPFCEDCELSDCTYCGVPTHRWNLSENLACRVCEEGEAA